jgi:hypothetical protein
MRLLVAAVSMSVGLGCGDGRSQVPSIVEREDAPRMLAEETCRSLFDCACPVNPYRTPEHCREVLELRGNDSDRVARLGELEYDGACVARQVTVRRDLACDFRDDEPCIPCRPFFGTGAAGDPCEKLGVTVDVDTCGQGLRCEDGICVELCPRLPRLGGGEPCVAGLEVLGACERGLHCDAATERCVVSPVVGEPCPDGVCTQDAWCDRVVPGESVCAEPLEEGQACFSNESCGPGHCERGHCVEPTPSVCALPPA